MKLMSGILLALALIAGPVGAAEDLTSRAAPGPNVVNVIMYVDVREAAIPRAIALLKQYRDAQSADGSAEVDLYQEIGRPYRFAINEQWLSRSGYDSSRPAQAISQLLAGLKDIQSAPPQEHSFRRFDVGPVRAMGGGRAQLYRISRFHVPGERQVQLLGVAKTLAEASRADQGGMRYDVLQGANPNLDLFAIFESWSNPDALEAHRSAAHVQRFREALVPLMISTFDDRLYGRII